MCNVLGIRESMYGVKKRKFLFEGDIVCFRVGQTRVIPLGIFNIYLSTKNKHFIYIGINILIYMPYSG